MTQLSAKTSEAAADSSPEQGARLIPQAAQAQEELGLLKNSAKDAFLSVAPGLAEVEARIRSRLYSSSDELSEISTYLLELGGKRIRPLLTLLSAKLFGLNKPDSRLIDAAAGIELIHMATLLHDDIIDESPKRRNQTSAFVKFGMPPTLLAGDFLLARAYGLCGHLGSFVIKETEQACVELSEGELIEGTLSPERKLSLENYRDVVSKKTASLFALAGCVGTHLSGASEANVSLLKNFGIAAGVAFQMVDDILDIAADEDLLGKPAGTDLRQKTPSLINVLWLESGDPQALAFFKEEKPSATLCKETVAYLSHGSIIEQARELAAKQAAEANSLLMQVNAPQLDATARQHLLSIVDYTLERCS